MSHIDKQNILHFICILVTGFIALFCFLPAVHYEFTNWDDNVLVTQNAQIRDLSPAGIIRIFTSFSLNHYHPFVTLSYSIELYLFGLNSLSFHLTNIILHALNSILVVILIRSMTKSTFIMLVTGFLFAIHPLRVESVVWIAERKDVLSAFFILLALIFYIRYRKVNSQKYFVIMISCFLGALLSKAMAVTLPILLLLYDYYIDGYVDRKRFREKIPLFLLSFLFGMVAIIAQYTAGISAKDPSFNVFKSFFLVPYGLLFYSIKFIYPFNLSPAYPYPETVGLAYPLIFWLSPLIVLIIFYCLYRFSRQHRLLLFSLLFYVVAILPVLQFIPVGRMIAADRFSYIPLLGLMFAAGQDFHFLWVSIENRRLLQVLLVVILSASAYGLFTLTRQQMSIWRSDKTLWSRVVKDNPSYAEGYNNLGITFAAEGNHAEAIRNLDCAIVLDSTDTEYFYNRGLLLMHMKRWGSAIQDFSRMIAINPQDISGYALRGNAYLENKSYHESISDYTKVLQVQPLAYKVRIDRIQALTGNGEYSAALDDIQYLNLTGVHLDSTFIKRIHVLAQTHHHQQ